MTPRPPEPIDESTLLALVRLARRVLDRLQATPEPMPPDIEKALRTFYDLTDYHGIAPADAPHIPDDGLI